MSNDDTGMNVRNAPHMVGDSLPLPWSVGTLLDPLWETRSKASREKICDACREAAGQGDAKAQSVVGMMFLFGAGVERDDKEAVQWFRKAAEQGDAKAQFHLGMMLMEGRGVWQDGEEADKWFREAAGFFLKEAERGDADAQTCLAILCAEGIGVRQSYEEAVKWYRKAAEQGQVSASAGLAFLYGEGLGVERSDEKAAEWYWKAAKEGGFGALECLRKAAEHGNVDAQVELALLYVDGFCFEDDDFEDGDEEAAKWFRKAAEQGHELAKSFLPSMENRCQTSESPL